MIVLAFAARGAARGLIAQSFAILGIAGGLWTAGWVSQWVEAQWLGAHPAVAFMVLRWLVTLTAALTVVALFHWWGDLLHDVTEATALKWLDRAGGLLAGGALGAILVTFLLLGALIVPWPHEIPSAAAGCRAARPAMLGGVRACALASRYFPGSNWLKRQVLVAERRANRGRSS